jgi:SNF2 family DNA or RNA helicase
MTFDFRKAAQESEQQATPKAQSKPGMITVTTKDCEFILQSGFKDKDTIKGIPGRRWNASDKTWRFPATGNAAAGIVAAFGAENIRCDAEFKKLAKIARGNAELQAVKEATGLPQPELRAKDSWPWQLQAYHFAKPQPATMLAMKMGRGKTKVAIDLIWNRNHRRTLVICPNKVQDVWAFELQKYAAMDDYLVHSNGKGTTVKRAQAIAQFLLDAERLGKRAVVVINYEAAWHEALAKVIAAAKFDFIILDESHRIKTPSGRASQFFSKIGDKTPYKLCLTGTPMPHSPLDIFGQYRFLDKGIFGTSFVSFRARYAVMGGYGGYEVKGYQREAELRDRFERIAFQCEADIGLADPIHIIRHITLEPKTQAVYNQMHRTFTAHVKDGTVTAANALSRLLRLQQITSGYLPVEEGQATQIGTEKRDELADILQDLDEREPVAVFCRFRHDLDQVKAAVEASGRKYAELSGRANELKAWQDGEADVLGVQIQAGKEGVSMVRARYCIYYSIGYSLGDYEQSLARLQRPGQTSQVTYIHLVARDTVDEKVYDALEKRKEVIVEILQGERV